MKIDEYFLPTLKDIKSVTIDFNTVYSTVIAHGLDLSNVYRGALDRAYNDYHYGHIAPVEKDSDVVPSDLHENSRGVFCTSNYVFTTEDEWMAVEKRGHTEVFSARYSNLNHIHRVFGEVGADEFMELLNLIRCFMIM